MIDEILKLFGRSLEYAQKLAADIPDAEMAVQPAAGMNHPAWTLGHLARTCDVALSALGQPALCPAEWKGIYGRDSHPSADRRLYGGKQELLAALVRGHEAVSAALRQTDPRTLEEPCPAPYTERFSNKRMMLIYMMIGHEMTHLGQVSAWRRVRGMKPV